MKPFPFKTTSRRRFFKNTLLSTLGLGYLSGGVASEPVQKIPETHSSDSANGNRPNDLLKPTRSDHSFSDRFEQFKEGASDEALYRLLYAMPKGGDIHHHMGGGYLPQRCSLLPPIPREMAGNDFTPATGSRLLLRPFNPNGIRPMSCSSG